YVFRSNQSYGKRIPFSNIQGNKIKEIFILTQTILRSLLFDAFHGQINYSELNSSKVIDHIKKTKANTIYSDCTLNMQLKELMKRTETYLTIINSKDGYTVKAFSTKLQPETLVNSTPLTSRLLLRTNKPLIRGCMPFW
ncbi:MAG: hypothetical protein LKH52_01130, partial [Lactobacillus crispatus]|nr:hypothetical protein [Lactobacillus crispatus]